jgi:hypothetical protein
MTFCGNEECDWIRRDHLGQLVCSAPVLSIAPSCDSQMNHYVLCGSYKPKSEPQIRELQPGRGRDGLYPGQIKPQ